MTPSNGTVAVEVLRTLGDVRDQHATVAVARACGTYPEAALGALRALRGHGLVESVERGFGSDQRVYWHLSKLGLYVKALLEEATT